MKLDIRYSNHPNDSKNYDTQTLRENYWIEKVFVADNAQFTYSHQDRIIAGGVMPVTKEVTLDSAKELGSDYFLERREMGVINIGGKGVITLDGQKFEINPREGMYVGMGTKLVTFSSDDGANPAKFYVNSCPAHHKYPDVVIDISKAHAVPLGDDVNLNKRVIYQFVHPAVCQSCQLVMGMTVLAKGSVWNTMPCHTHERRMEVYLYFDLPSDQFVVHLMGPKQETRHVIMRNEQAVISPSWSIHSGVGTTNYTFIWGMCGENQTFTDMDDIPMEELI